MKKILMIMLIIVLGITIKIPEYEELNNLAIIETIGINYNNEIYTIYLKEIIPEKKEQGIKYEYEYYQGEGKSIKNAYAQILKKTKKKIHLKRCKYFVTNEKYSDKAIKELNVNPINVYHYKKDIYDKIKKIS